MQLRNTILLVEEVSETRETLRKIFENKYNILEAQNIEQAYSLMGQQNTSIAAMIVETALIVGRDGGDNNDIPIIAIIEDGDVQSEYLAFEMGACDVIRKPFYPELIEKRVAKMIALHSHKWNLSEIVEEQRNQLLHSNEVMVDALVSIIESRSLESSQHILRIRRFTQILLEVVARNCPEYNLDKAQIQAISSAASLHDIGKISIPDSILKKPGPLTEEEFEIMKTHTVAGCSILRNVEDMASEDYMRYAYNICRYHHERWDGGGYPDGLVGDDIPICAQAASIADVYDALTTERVYKPAYSTSEAVNKILRGDCGAFSPRLLECFKLVIGDFAELTNSYKGGHNAASDAIAVPLEPPKRTTDNAIQYVMSKYDVLLHYVNATVIEIDLDKDLYQLVYNPNADLALMHNAKTLDEVMQILGDHLVHPDDRTMVYEHFREYLNEFFEMGLMRRIRHYRIKSADGSYHNYEITTLRISFENGGRKALAIWMPKEAENMSVPFETNIDQSRMTGISLRCRCDRWLTLDGCSPELAKLLGYTVEEVRDRYRNRLIELILHQDRDYVTTQIERQITEGSNITVEMPLYHKGGAVVWGLINCVVTNGEDGISYLNGVLIDTSRSKASNKALMNMITYHKSIFEHTSDIMFEWNAIDKKFKFSSSITDRFQPRDISTDFINNIEDTFHFHPDDLHLYHRQIKAFHDGAPFVEFTVRLADKNGKYTWNRIRAAARHDAEGRLSEVLGVIIDVDNELQLSSDLLESVEHDTLTKLLNKDTARRQIELRLASRNAEQLSAMILIDLDNFKAVNDTYGHMFGDTLLMRIASEITHLFRGTDILARIGGDEFLVYMTNIPHKKLALHRSEELVEAIMKLYSDQFAHLGFSCSIGIVYIPEHGVSYQDLFQRADRALYRAKSEGKACCMVYDPEVPHFHSPSMVNIRIDSDVNMDSAENNLTNYAFNRLYESGDVVRTIQSLIEIVGRQMDVSRVYIFENNHDNTFCSNTFEWCNTGVTPEIDNLQNVSYRTDIPNYEKNFNEFGIFYCADISRLSDDLRAILEPQGIQSMLQCAIRDNGQFRGYVGFDENNEMRMWTKEQINKLIFMAQIISVFLLKERKQRATEQLLGDMQMILNNQYSWVYVVEPQSFKLRFVNHKTLDLTPTAKLGRTCHKTFMNRETPCPDCPILKEGEDKSSLIRNEYFHLSVKASANSIHWNGQDAWLVSCREIDKDEQPK